MNASKTQTIASNILENWCIAELRCAFPVQLRPHSGTIMAPTLVTALSDLSMILRHRVEWVKTLLRDAVRERCEWSRGSGEAVVTTAGVLTTKSWILAQLKDIEFKRSPKVGNDPNAAGGALPTIIPRPPGCDWQPLRPQSLEDTSVEAPKESPARSSRSSSFPRLEDIGIDLVQPVDSEHSPLRTTGETMISSPSIVQEERPSLELLWKKQLEADMHRLLAQENGHRRRAEEYRIRATRHERRALALKMQVAEIETELTYADDALQADIKSPR